jgi:thiol-disulfide isomerase/thioredoxin
MQMDLGEKSLPFNFTVNQKGSKLEMYIINGEESIYVQDIKHIKDSLFIDLPIFESAFELKIIDSTQLEGVWVNYYKGPDYQLKVKAKHGEAFRFNAKEEGFEKPLATKYEVLFTESDSSSFPAIGILEQDDHVLSGTFATETGDYRHLVGEYHHDSIFLSTFDGSHAFLFIGENQDSLIKGTFWSGNHYKANWVAKPNKNAKLRDPDSLTFLKEGYDSLYFSLPNAKGEMVSLEDSAYENKVVIVQIMGSWCPNCLDETRFLTQLYKRYHKEGLELIALAFERTSSKEKALQNLAELQQETQAPYPFLLGGWNRDSQPTTVLPMLNKIMSYPTAIFIDRKGEVRKIHTGFYGPGTGDYYQEFVSDTEQFVETLLSE